MAGVTGPVHFLHLGGDLCWQHYRAIHTAKVHDAPIFLWTVDRPAVAVSPMLGYEFKPLDLPDWLRDHPIQLANVKDLYAYRILYEHGGIYLDLDTISLRPAWDLLHADVCVGREYDARDAHPHPYNSAVVLAREGAPVLDWMAEESFVMLANGVSEWGSIGPHLLTEAVGKFSEAFTIAPYRALNGWSYHRISDYYAHPRDPGEPTRVIHLYSSDHLGEFYADRWMPQT